MGKQILNLLVVVVMSLVLASCVTTMQIPMVGEVEPKFCMNTEFEILDFLRCDKPLINLNLGIAVDEKDIVEEALEIDNMSSLPFEDGVYRGDRLVALSSNYLQPHPGIHSYGEGLRH